MFGLRVVGDGGYSGTSRVESAWGCRNESGPVSVAFSRRPVGPMHQIISSAKYMPFIIPTITNGFMIMYFIKINSDKNATIEALQRKISFKEIPIIELIFGAFSIIVCTLIIYVLNEILVYFFPEVSNFFNVSTVFDYLFWGAVFSFLLLCGVFAPKIISDFWKVKREQTLRLEQQQRMRKSAIKNLKER